MKTLADLHGEQRIAEKRLVRSALVLNRWNCNQAAAQLGISASTLITTMRRLGVLDEYRSRCPKPGRPKKRKLGEAPQKKPGSP